LTKIGWLVIRIWECELNSKRASSKLLLVKQLTSTSS
jgi:G:T-mismatch repair DNA endonuclease (very short patch repair protein)